MARHISKAIHVSRRALIGSLLPIAALTLFRAQQSSSLEDKDAFVEVDGWILKRSDLA